ncbi:hypothetical protein Ahy_A05g022979 isoform A [Arachis hypogaea]|uniref:Uncharacterized protein n=1 Tax=Arachis hypogaea TaxID=3818 RepID=A0A445D256_ARAHY|nr:hypothetical protein Ahy_A05g022979 isoform A [Arachis hypogaea]
MSHRTAAPALFISPVSISTPPVKIRLILKPGTPIRVIEYSSSNVMFLLPLPLPLHELDDFLTWESKSFLFQCSSRVVDFSLCQCDVDCFKFLLVASGRVKCTNAPMIMLSAKL